MVTTVETHLGYECDAQLMEARVGAYQVTIAWYIEAHPLIFVFIRRPVANNQDSWPVQ